MQLDIQYTIYIYTFYIALQHQSNSSLNILNNHMNEKKQTYIYLQNSGPSSVSQNETLKEPKVLKNLCQERTAL